MTLSDITMRQFVDILCGDTSLFGDMPQRQKLKERSALAFDFAKLSDPATAERHLVSRSRAAKQKAVLQYMKICRNLAEVGMEDDARALLIEYGETRLPKGLEALKVCIDSLIKRAQRDIDLEGEEEGKEQSESDIRQSYDRQCATLMAHFKFQIDMDTIKASQFACLVRQATLDIRAQKAAMAKYR